MSLSDAVRFPLPLDVREVLIGVPLDRAVLAGRLHDAPKLGASSGVLDGIDVLEISERDAHALALDGVERADDELACRLDWPSARRGAAGDLTKVVLERTVLAFEIIGGLADPMIVVAVIEALVVAAGDAADVLEEAASSRAFATSRSGGELLPQVAAELAPYGLAVHRTLLPPEDSTNVSKDVDVLAQLVAKLGPKRDGLQGRCDLFKERPPLSRRSARPSRRPSACARAA